MLERLVFLTGDFDVSGYVALLKQLNPACRIDHVTNLAQLLEAIDAPAGTLRLLSFCSGTIVPGNVLDRLGAPAYNIHPGPPAYPGSHPECWAVYFGAPVFGATLHVMAPRVDEGAIVDTTLFDVPTGAGHRELGEKAFLAALELLMRWTPVLIGSNDPLPLSGERWTRRKWSRADREKISHISIDIDLPELERRCRAFAEQPPGRLSLTLGGLTFTYSPPSAA